ncbi:hypothetical protein ABEI56_05380 [Peribacillus castrilensis]|uniref:hypothetical protein n=1 Tax=Peribacillus castrilensis TaxID=2897690 RepID=UPI003D2D4642
MDDKKIICPSCKKEIKKEGYFYTDNKVSIKNYGMCFDCCRYKLGHAGYGE